MKANYLTHITIRTSEITVIGLRNPRQTLHHGDCLSFFRLFSQCDQKQYHQCSRTRILRHAQIIHHQTPSANRQFPMSLPLWLRCRLLRHSDRITGRCRENTHNECSSRTWIRRTQHRRVHIQGGRTHGVLQGVCFCTNAYLAGI